MKKIEKITEKIHGEYFLETAFFVWRLVEILYPKDFRSIRKYEYLRKIFFRVGKKEPVVVIFEKSGVYMSYGSALLGLEELISIHKDDVFCEELQKFCDYLHQKNDEFAPDFEIKQKKQDFIYQTKTGKKMVNLKAIAMEFEIEDKPEFQEAIKDGKAKIFDTFRFDEVFGEFVEAEKALHVLNIYTHYAKDKQLNKIIEEII